MAQLRFNKERKKEMESKTERRIDRERDAQLSHGSVDNLVRVLGPVSAEVEAAAELGAQGHGARVLEMHRAARVRAAVHERVGRNGQARHGENGEAAVGHQTHQRELHLAHPRVHQRRQRLAARLCQRQKTKQRNCRVVPGRESERDFNRNSPRIKPRRQSEGKKQKQSTKSQT